jgi:hypothetical protein
MPRLVGKQSNGSQYTRLLIFFVIVAAGSLEYFGFTNLIPGFGRDQNPSSLPHLQLRR